MRCPYCSEEIPADSAFCEHCGTAVMEPERTSSAEAQQLQAQPITGLSSEGRSATSDPGVPQSTSPGKVSVGILVGAAVGALPGILILLLTVFFEVTTTTQGSGTGIGLLALGGIGLVAVGGVVGAILGGVVGGFRKTTRQSVAAERCEEDTVVTASDATLAPWYRRWVVVIYDLVLLAIATKVINRFSWSKAVIAVFPAIAFQICNLL